MAIIPKDDMCGRMRKRIAVVEGVGRKKRSFTTRNVRFPKDKSLNVFLHSGAVTREQVEHAISSYRQSPSSFAWLANVDEALLEKADRVFYCTYSRRPFEDADFRISGSYHKICRSLEHDFHYYDDQLDKLSRTDREDAPARNQDNVFPPQKKHTRVNAPKPARSRTWAFGAVLVLGLASAPLLATLIVNYFSTNRPIAGLMVGGLWLGILVVAIVLTLPWRPHQDSPYAHRASESSK